MTTRPARLAGVVMDNATAVILVTLGGVVGAIFKSLGDLIVSIITKKGEITLAQQAQNLAAAEQTIAALKSDAAVKERRIGDLEAKEENCGRTLDRAVNFIEYMREKWNEEHPEKPIRPFNPEPTAVHRPARPEGGGP